MSDPNIHLQVPDKLLLDLLTTAYEGGSAYWLACDHIERDADLNVTRIIGCYDREDSDTTWPDVTLDTMREGVRKLVTGEAKVRKDILHHLCAVIVDPDDSGWDAEVADVVLQVGLLGEIVYG